MQCKNLTSALTRHQAIDNHVIVSKHKDINETEKESTQNQLVQKFLKPF